MSLLLHLRRSGRKSQSSEIPQWQAQDLFTCISKIKASRRKIKELPEFHHHTLVRARKLFLFVQDWKGFQGNYPHELRWYLLSLWFSLQRARLFFLPTVTRIGRPIKSLSAEFDTGAFISVIHQDFVAFIDWLISVWVGQKQDPFISNINWNQVPQMAPIL